MTLFSLVTGIYKVVHLIFYHPALQMSVFYKWKVLIEVQLTYLSLNKHKSASIFIGFQAAAILDLGNIESVIRNALIG